MRINDVCKACRLTKKAVEYYAGQGLIHPSVSENGYRAFTKDQVERLKKVAVLRGLGLSVADIQNVLDKENGGLNKVIGKKELAVSELMEKQELMEKLARDNDWESARLQLETLQKKQSILQRLQEQFPGFYGQYLNLHFAPFLSEPIVTGEQQQAFEAIIAYLDGVQIALPEELQQVVDEACQSIGSAMPDVTKGLSEALGDTEQYMTDHKETLERYMQLLQSDEYRQSPAYRLKEALKQLNRQNGYDAVFIPAMKRLSPSYQKYHDDLLKANAVFLSRYGDKWKAEQE